MLSWRALGTCPSYYFTRSPQSKLLFLGIDGREYSNGLFSLGCFQQVLSSLLFAQLLRKFVLRSGIVILLPVFSFLANLSVSTGHMLTPEVLDQVRVSITCLLRWINDCNSYISYCTLFFENKVERLRTGGCTHDKGIYSSNNLNYICQVFLGSGPLGQSAYMSLITYLMKQIYLKILPLVWKAKC